MNPIMYTIFFLSLAIYIKFCTCDLFLAAQYFRCFWHAIPIYTQYIYTKTCTHQIFDCGLTIHTHINSYRYKSSHNTTRHQGTTNHVICSLKAGMRTQIIWGVTKNLFLFCSVTSLFLLPILFVFIVHCTIIYMRHTIGKCCCSKMEKDHLVSIWQ